MKKTGKILFTFIAILFVTANSYAQTAVKDEWVDSGKLLIFEFIVLFVLFNAVFIPLLMDFGGKRKRAKKKSIFALVTDKISGLKPISEEHSLLIDEDYDGIQELDNNVPPWFNILFYGTVVIAVIYMLNYHVFKTGKLPFQEYADEVYDAELVRNELIRSGAFINESTVELLKDNESLNNGKMIFSNNCIPCHGMNAEGTVGPNLTDSYWIHGGGIKNVFKTIKYGVPEKGMITWKNQLNPKMIQQVASFVLSLPPVNGKAPEGNLYIDSANIKTDSLQNVNIKKDSLMSDTKIKSK